MILAGGVEDMELGCREGQVRPLFFVNVLPAGDGSSQLDIIVPSNIILQCSGPAVSMDEKRPLQTRTNPTD